MNIVLREARAPSGCMASMHKKDQASLSLYLRHFCWGCILYQIHLLNSSTTTQHLTSPSLCLISHHETYYSNIAVLMPKYPTMILHPNTTPS